MPGPIREVLRNTLVGMVPVNVEDVDGRGPKLGGFREVRLNQGHHVGQAKSCNVGRSRGDAVSPGINAMDVSNSRGGKGSGGEAVVNPKIDNHSGHPIPHNPLREVVQPSPGRSNLNKIHLAILHRSGTTRNRKLSPC